MSPICLSRTPTLLYTSNPPQPIPKRAKISPFSITLLPSSTLKFSPFAAGTIFRYGNWVSPRNKFYANSSDSDVDSREEDTQLSPKNASVSSYGGNPSTSLLSFLCPLLKFFSGGDPSGERNDTLEVVTSSLSSLARFPWGSKSLSNSLDREDTNTIDPPMRLQLFEFEACPFCRRVREAITELDLSVEVYPCPKGSLRHREMVRRFGGKEQFPFLIDPNTGITMYESGDIVKYLFQQYGQGRKPSAGLLESTLVTGWVPTLLRAGRGMTLWEKARLDPPPKMLELFSYENNQYARIVREALCELEVPYILQNVGEGSSRSKILISAIGSKEVLKSETIRRSFLTCFKRIQQTVPRLFHFHDYKQGKVIFDRVTS
ncbi:uncharacterized protein LOC133803461 isoform X1 [Humulus lupulus]|uniref:uncharacterized protein LOC133803461 isoform X1 n=1 Tax=Humulus lupulus TaxID=3486 RepID=UPI002B413604|nr:uncharacterized protein LOC133803461 isoform X1 [Humulus lupulus]